MTAVRCPLTRWPLVQSIRLTCVLLATIAAAFAIYATYIAALAGSSWALLTGAAAVALLVGGRAGRIVDAPRSADATGFRADEHDCSGLPPVMPRDRSVTVARWLGITLGLALTAISFPLAYLTYPLETVGAGVLATAALYGVFLAGPLVTAFSYVWLCD